MPMQTEYQKKLIDDFRLVLWIVWKYLNLPEPTPIQYDIAQYLQHGPRRKIIQAFRGVGKSWVTAAYVIWRLLGNPQYKIMVVSASKERADAFAIFVKKLINEVPEFQHLKARPNQRDTMIAFDVGPATPDQSPSVKSVGITGQLTGSRADEIIADDVEIPSNSATQMQRDKLSELVKEFDAVLKPGGRITYLGTPQTEMSLYNVLPSRGYDIRIWPALFPTEKQKKSYGDRLAPIIVKWMEKGDGVEGFTTEPDRFTNVDLGERLASYGRAGFALQFMLDTSLSDADRYPLKVADLITMTLNPSMGHMKVVWAAAPELVWDELPNVAMNGDRFYRPMFHEDMMSEYTGCVMVIDPSGRGKDETAYAVVKILNGTLFLMAVGGFTTGYTPETLQALSMIAAKHNAKHVLIEANFGDGMFTELLKPVMAKVHPVTIEEVKHSKQKELRIIDTLEPVLLQHRLVIDSKVIKEDYESAKDADGQHDVRRSFIYQMTRVTREKGALIHDDRLDAVAMAVAYWVEAMARDADKGLRNHKDKLMADELKRFVANQKVLKGPSSIRVGWSASNKGVKRR